VIGEKEDQLKEVWKFLWAFGFTRQTHRYCRACCFDPRVSDEFHVRRILQYWSVVKERKCGVCVPTVGVLKYVVLVTCCGCQWQE